MTTQLTLSEANRKCAEILGWVFKEIDGHVLGTHKDHPNFYHCGFDFRVIECSELLLKYIEESNCDYTEAYYYGDKGYKFQICSKSERNNYYNKNKLINRMIAFLSWKLGKDVVIKDGE